MGTMPNPSEFMMMMKIFDTVNFARFNILVEANMKFEVFFNVS
jgi:hypothetical protein